MFLLGASCSLEWFGSNTLPGISFESPSPEMWSTWTPWVGEGALKSVAMFRIRTRHGFRGMHVGSTANLLGPAVLTWPPGNSSEIFWIQHVGKLFKDLTYFQNTCEIHMGISKNQGPNMDPD